MIKSIKVGSRLVEKGKIFRVFKIEKKGSNGTSGRIIHYKPHFTGTLNGDIICCVPESSLEEINIRSPLPKKEVKLILDKFSKKLRKVDDLDVNASKEALRENDLEVTAEIVHRYWTARKRSEDTFTKSNKDLLEAAIMHFIEEVAFVFNISPDKARERTISALEN